MPNRILTHRKYSILLPPHHSDRRVQGSVQLFLRSAVICRVRGSQMSIRTQGVMPIKEVMPWYSQLLGIVILNISYLTIFYNYTFLPTVLCRPTLLYKRDNVENSTAVISLIDYKNRDKFPFYPNNTPESLSKAMKNTICVVLTYNDYLCNNSYLFISVKQ